MDVDCHVYCISVIILSIIRRNHIDAEEFVLCKEESKELQCGIGKKIKILTIEQEKLNSPCKSLDKENCTENFTEMIEGCNGQHNCTLNGRQFLSSVCKVYPRKLSVTYTCSGYLFWKTRYRDVCFSLMDISCSNRYWISRIAYNLDIFVRCDKPLTDITSCLTRQFNTGCIGNKHCDQRVTDSWCLNFPYAVYVSYRCYEDNANNTNQGNDQRPTFTIKSDNTSIIINGSGFPVFPGLSGTSRFPNITGLTPVIDPIQEINYGIILGSCGGVLLLIVIVISTVCFLRYRGKPKTTKNQHLELAEEYSEISPFHNVSTSSAQHQENSYFILDPNAKMNPLSNENNTCNSGLDRDDHYAMTSEGVYDVTNDKRHKESDTLYSHAIDDVYDMSSSTRKDLSNDYDAYS